MCKCNCCNSKPLIMKSGVKRWLNDETSLKIDLNRLKKDSINKTEKPNDTVASK